MTLALKADPGESSVAYCEGDEAGRGVARVLGARNVSSVRVRGFASLRGFLDEPWDVVAERLEELAKS